jgi:purine nucleoside permease
VLGLTALLAGHAGAAPPTPAPTAPATTAPASTELAPTAPAFRLAQANTIVPTRARPLPVKVLIINLFSLEAAPWIAALKPTLDIPVPGLSRDYPYVRCNGDGVCQMTTAMGHANAAASVMAVVFSRLFDLHQTYFLIAGIAGIDPAHGTLGSAAWARYVVDSGIAHEIDARELPKGWSDGYFGVMTDGPDEVPKFEYHTEVFRLDEALLQQALALSRGAKLEDAADLKAYRSHYPQAAASHPPTVIQCDTLSGDTWWTGRRLGEHASHWMRLLTGGKGVYCTTQEEDNAVLNALTRASDAKLIDLRRVADLRTGSDFDRPYPGQQALAALQDQRALGDAVTVAAANLVHAGMPLVAAIVAHWSEWQHGIPAAPVQTGAQH